MPPPEEAARLPEEATPLLASPGELKANLSGIQRAGLRLALGVGSLIALVTVICLAYWWLHSPNIPQDLLNAQSTAANKELLANYKELANSAAEQAKSIFDLIVTKALLPVFTAILGYIFGTRNSSD